MLNVEVPFLMYAVCICSPIRTEMKPDAVSFTFTLIVTFSPNVTFVAFTAIVVFNLGTMNRSAASAEV